MILDVNALAQKTRRKSSVDALILDVQAMALNRRGKSKLEAMKSSTHFGYPVNQSSNNSSPTNAKKIHSSISEKETNPFTLSSNRKMSENLDTFLFSLVPNKL